PLYVCSPSLHLPSVTAPAGSLCPLLLLPFSLYCSAPPRHLHSFPTRRSSDLPKIGELPGMTPSFQVFPSRVAVTRWEDLERRRQDRKSTRLNSSHRTISYAVFCLKKKKKNSEGYSVR